MEILISWLFYVFCPLVLLIWLYYVSHLGNDSPIHYVGVQDRRTEMISVHNPFIFDLNRFTARYSGVDSIISSEIKFFFIAFWDMPIIDVFKLMGKEWHALQDCVQSVEFVNKYNSTCNPLQCDPCAAKHLKISPRYSLEAVRRFENYPLVVLMVREEDLDPSAEVQVVALMSIVHIKDSRHEMETQILDQYSKLSNGKLINIKKLFTSSPDSDTLFYACVVCQERGVSRVILPCRHACVCGTCFDRLDMCPVCRGPLQTFFSLQGVPAPQDRDSS